MNRRVLLILLVLILLCTPGMTCLGLSGGPFRNARLDLSTSSIQKLRGRLADPLPVDHLRLTGGSTALCKLDPARLGVPVIGGCTYAIQPGGTRRLRLQLGAGAQSIRILLQQPEYLKVNQTLQTGRTIDLDVFSSEQSATLTFQGCAVEEPEKTTFGLSGVCFLEIQE